ncbi:uncharacterized protein LOC107879771 [Capsicum annuum]|uniref:uncharacterized protein LOC107879771 n=1 Tax=Capsicum annuum TaxID=4072 RepID=UPI0007BEF03B|nr:uncharacterized protein LOC107879771 [Capsicum annuum]
MSMSKNQVRDPFVYVRRRRTQRTQLVANVEPSFAPQEISMKETGQTGSKTQRTEPNKLLENTVAKTSKEERTKDCSNSSKLKTRLSTGGDAGNAKVISDNKVDKRKTWKPQTQEETNWNQLALVNDGNTDYVTSQLDFANDAGGEAQKNSLQFPLNNTSGSSNNAKRKGKEIYQEKNKRVDFADIYAQRRNKGITICEMNSRSEVAKLLGKSCNDNFSGKKLHSQGLNQVRSNYFLGNSMKGMRAWPSLHERSIMVHPSKNIGPSRFSPYYDQCKPRTSVPAPLNFSVMKLITDDEKLTDEELLYGKELLSTQGLSAGDQRVQVPQPPCSQVGNHQNTKTNPESVSSNFSYMKLLMDDDSSTMDNEIYEKEFRGTQPSLLSSGETVKQWPCSQAGTYHSENSSQKINLPSYQHQVLQQPQKISYRDLLQREDISYVDLLTREDISWT